MLLGGLCTKETWGHMCNHHHHHHHQEQHMLCITRITFSLVQRQRINTLHTHKFQMHITHCVSSHQAPVMHLIDHRVITIHNKRFVINAHAHLLNTERCIRETAQPVSMCKRSHDSIPWYYHLLNPKASKAKILKHLVLWQCKRSSDIIVPSDMIAVGFRV